MIKKIITSVQVKKLIYIARKVYLPIKKILLKAHGTQFAVGGSIVYFI